MTNELIEKIARAMYESDVRPAPWSWGDLSRHVSGNRIFNSYIRSAHAALAAIEASGTHVVVPVEPTEAMESAASLNADVRVLDAHAAFSAMLSARPKVTE